MHPSSLAKNELLALAPKGLEADLMDISAQLLARGWMLTSAESCTGGLIAAACTNLPGSSQWFERGFVSYSNAAKNELLGVPTDLIDAHGAVSEPVVRAMAEGALAHARAQVSIAVTGIAGPTGASEGKPVGTVWFGWCIAGQTHSEVMLFAGNRSTVRQATLCHALARLAGWLAQRPPAAHTTGLSTLPTKTQIDTLQRLTEQNQTLQTQLKDLIQVLNKKEKLYRQLTDDTRDVLWQTDAALRLTYISPADERLRGFTAQEMVGRHVFEMFTDEGIALVQQKMQARAIAESQGKRLGFALFEIQHRCKDGQLLWGEILAKPDRNAEGSIVGYHGITREITERRLLQDKVHELAFYDALTQLANRRLLIDHLSQALLSIQRKHGHGALLFLDLDNFKALNDAHGHGAGDLLLIEVARRLKACVRNIDTVARFGGDEFVVLLGTLSGEQDQAVAQTSAIGEKIRASLAQPYLITVTTAEQPDTTVEHHGSASIGAVVFSQDDTAPHDIIDRADKAMYQAKKGGRNRVCFASDDADKTAEKQPYR
ncbi:MAG: nicotinamide-nucleotide amidohydrolase family protein [Giesbergeria sp.]|nr:nicotinamide-nucleotide amidohydrolase family protein [Giesbergeria sp.]MBP6599856.1 nicotinamide-nucleotide amidohydrolase family protein [Giesbergeria sp.]